MLDCSAAKNHSSLVQPVLVNREEDKTITCLKQLVCRTWRGHDSKME